MSRIKSVLICVLLMAIYPNPTGAQAVQAYEDIRSQGTPSVAVSGEIVSAIELFTNLANDPRTSDSDRTAFLSVASEGLKLLQMSTSESGFAAAYDRFKASVTNALPAGSSNPLKSRGPVVPQIQQYAPAVSFVAATSFTTTEAKGIWSVDLSTNLLGAAVGTAFDALGSDALKKYFTTNLSAGTSLPYSGEGKISGDIGLGMGGVSVLGVTFWPVLGLSQLDSADSRVPRDLVARKATEDNWSQPNLTVALVPKQFLNNLKAGKPAAILTVGVTMPYYYPGDPFAGLAALFSAKRNEFEKQGKAHFTIGLSIPLFKVGGSKEEEAKP